MSASEKLKVLDFTDTVLNGDSITLYHALPQIVAVVEAAEAIMRIPIVATAEMRFVADKQVDLHRSVNALEEALS